MAIEAERLIINIEARLNSFERDMRKAAGITDTNMRTIERRAQQAQRSVEGSFKGLAAGITSGIGGALAGVGVAAFASSARDLTRQIASIGNEAKRAGLSSKAFQELSFVAEQTRVPIDALIDGMKELSLRSDEFITTGAGPAADAIKRLGFTADELKTKLKDPSALLVEIVGRLGRLNTAAQVRVADELFGGTGGERFVEILDKGSDGIQQMIRDANDFGLIVDEQMIAKADEVDRKFNLIATTIGTGLKKAIVNAGTSLGEFLDQFKEVENQQAVTLRAGIASNFQKQAALQGTISDLKREKSESYFPNLVQQQITIKEGELAKIVADYQVLQSALDKFTGLAGDGLGKVGAAATDAAEKVSTLGTTSTATKQKLVSAPIETAEKFRGATEGRDGNILSGFFKAANVNIDPKMTAWCAAFVNAALATNGLPGTGSNLARSFQNYGEETKNPTRGDIVVLSRGKNTRQGHVGFFEGYDEKGGVRVLGGNQDDSVSTKSFSKDRVLSFRKIPGAERSSEADTLAAELERRKDVTAAMQGQTNAYNELVAGSVEYIASLKAEQTAASLTAEQAEKLRIEQELLNQAAQAGLTITPELAAAFSDLATGMAAAKVENEQFHASQQLTIDQMDNFRDGARDVLGGFISDLREGKSASEALGNALANIADRLLQSGLDSVIDSLFGKSGTNAGGILGSLFSGGATAATGGFYATGGYTGPGGKNQPAGIVHKGEYVMSKAAVERIGLQNLERMHQGYASGGLVGMTPPSLRASPSSPGPVNVKVINQTGVQAEPETRMQPDGSVEVVLRKMVADEVGTRGRRTNGVLRNGFGASPALRNRG